MDFDVAIVGAGPGGCLAAKNFAQAGLRVGLFDAGQWENLGKPVVVEIEAGIFKQVGLKPPSPEEIPYEFSRIRAFTTKGHPGFDIPGTPTYSIYQGRFTKKIAGQAVTAGARFFGKHKAIEPIVREGKVTGVVFRVGQKKQEVSAKLVIDATGFDAALVRRLDPDLGMEFYDDPGDVVVAINELASIDVEKARRSIGDFVCGDEEMWTIFGTAGSYSTEFFYVSTRKKTAYVLLGFKEQIGEKPADRLRDFKKRHRYYRKKLYGTEGKIRIRHSLPRLVTDGFLALGEAACMVIPIHGSGVASALWAAHLAASVAVPLLKSKTPLTTAALWPYAAFYQTGRGRLLATYEISRLTSERFTARQVEVMVEEGIIAGEDMVNGAYPREFQLSAATASDRLRGLANHPDLIGPVIRMATGSLAVSAHYANYPRTFDPETFEAWKQKERILFDPFWARSL